MVISAARQSLFHPPTISFFPSTVCCKAGLVTICCLPTPTLSPASSYWLSLKNKTERAFLALLFSCLQSSFAKMNSRRIWSSKEKRLKRKEVLEKKKAIEEIIKSASAVKDHLASSLAFCHYDRNGLSVYLESGHGHQLSSPIKSYIQNLLKVNMEGSYGPEWPMEEKVKRREMVSPEAQYIFVRESSNVIPDDNFPKEDARMICWTGSGDRLVGFVHYRFIVEEEIPVIYVYELQLEICARGRGLGKFLMQLVELIAWKNRMGAVMLTVQKANTPAINFYTNRLRYVISSISPSNVDPLIGAEKSYEILCKTFNSQAKVELEAL